MSPNGKHSEKTPDPEAMPEGIEEVGAFLRRWRDPVPDPAAKASLMEMLAVEMLTVELARGAAARHASPLARRHSRQRITWAWLILRSQVRLVHPATWVASGLLIALGALVTLAFYQPTQGGSALALVIVAPIVAACGVAFVYGEDADPALELQWATPVSPRLILLARLALLFGFNLAITLVCSIALTLMQAQISLMPLVLAWLAPMTFLSALAFLLSAIFFDSLASVLICLLIWVGAAARHFIEIEVISLYVPDLLRAANYPAMLIAAPVLVLAALWLAEREERWTRGTP